MDVTDAEKAAIRDTLLAWRAAGTEQPVIPVYRDVDVDGAPDFYGLDAFGRLTVVSGVTVADTVSVSEGDL
ncbi:hypothetical protein [Microbacterium rhizophilus]|uniref:hypothetical protein n=1 Tax=Microbacterium rhizophilus TaxID=3138934 RepID=UPI0031EFF495